MIQTLADAGLFLPLVTVLGLLIGSFLNVVVHRLPIMMENELRLDCEWLSAKDNGLPEPDPTAPTGPIFNLSKPRSRCPQCDTQIRARDNIPVLSWVLLKGRCRGCDHPISARYPIVEASTAALSLLVAWVMEPSLATIAALALVWTLWALTLIDADTQLLPDQLTLPLTWAGLLVATTGVWPVSLTDALFGAVFGYLSLWSVFHLFRILTGKHGMGAGDFKLLAALGAWMGWQVLPLIIVLSSLVGAVVGISAIALAKMGARAPMAFGPYLAGAGLIALLWGAQLIDGYKAVAGL
ncbi:prepilin peptidase [Litorivicinus lipolyticus]|uniref:Prepilin leader peptidase/N-methyltransferase n=1 Tax=Litorivicinus lipolyticus TaxID=418701 RepID=A0A5Q2QEY5_9GAMM|nr:A24 family peptidase [Litorivicinus lipolyticus]QGG80931.1 prepilin peptidase [Litorivicinus lipolyticus]